MDRAYMCFDKVFCDFMPIFCISFEKVMAIRGPKWHNTTNGFS
jgi:hypothetical protein